MSEQRQDSLTDQLRDLIHLANKAGMYDAADYLRDVVEQPPFVGFTDDVEEVECGNCGAMLPGEHEVLTTDGAFAIVCPRHTSRHNLREVHEGFIAQCDRCAVVGTPIDEEQQ